MTYGHRIRKLTMGRKGKEGNNAFADDLSKNDYDEDYIQSVVDFVMETSGITKVCVLLYSNTKISGNVRAACYSLGRLF